jgi:hypothetical protein
MSQDEPLNYEQIIHDLKNRVEYLERRTGYKKPELTPEMVEYIHIQPPELTLDDVFNYVSGISLQTIFRDIDDQTLAGVLYSLNTPEEVNKIRKNVSKNHFMRLLDYIKDGYFGTVSERLEPYREKFMNSVRQLEEMGMIVVEKDDDTRSYVDMSQTLTPEFWEKRRAEQKKQRQEMENKIQEWMKRTGLSNDKS